MNSELLNGVFFDKFVVGCYFSLQMVRENSMVRTHKLADYLEL